MGLIGGGILCLVIGLVLWLPFHGVIATLGYILFAIGVILLIVGLVLLLVNGASARRGPPV